MASPGRLPKVPYDQQRRPGRNLADKAAVHLPIEGRFGRTPAWPLSKTTKRESEIWTRLWRKPQALMWERDSAADVVARYVRLLVLAEQPSPDFEAVKEVRQMEDRLGLTPMAMLRLRWSIESGETTERSEGKVVDIRERLKAVDE